MTLLDDFFLVYPGYRSFARSVTTLPLSARSLLIKACQAQRWPSGTQPSSLYNLIVDHPEVIFCPGPNHIVTRPLIDFIPYFNISLEDPLVSAIILDMCRGLPLSYAQADEARLASWNKEITLAQGTSCSSSQIDWDVFFLPGHHKHPLSLGVDPNPNMARHIHNKLCVFRRDIAGTRFWPRATHKNMSRSTRREFEKFFWNLDDVSIFGQDDWEYVYHHHGVKLGGVCEMRQKWYPSGAKPRTYFAMGGEAYASCRFLQDFFTRLVNTFVPTHHMSRLQPDRLYIDPDSRDQPHFRIYDLSNFTSNMREQKFFMQKLADFMTGVDVEIIDERDGPIIADLGDLLHDYVEVCVIGPSLSLERFDPDLDTPFPHGIASLLGIFGNLMSCTVGHFLIVSPVVTNDEEVNVAGDDGLIPEDALNNEPVRRVIGLVGSWALEKTFRGDEEAAICLKRPFVEHIPTCSTFHNIVPPSLATASAYLSGTADPRYSFFHLEEMTIHQRISLVGKDLIRFLRSAFLRGYTDHDRLADVVRGFGRLAERYFRFRPEANIPQGVGGNYTWPMDPLAYEFETISPMHVLALYRSAPYRTIQRMEVLQVDTRPYIHVGDSFEGNMTGRLKLLERLGYLTSEELTVEIEETEIAIYWARILDPRVYVPSVYRFDIIRDIPVSFQAWE